MTLQRALAIGLVVTLISTLAAVAAIQSSTEDAEAQVDAYPMNYLCLDLYTGLYKGSFTASCPPHQQLLILPDAYPLTLCASAWTSYLRQPLPNGECPQNTSVRIDLPSPTPVNVCYVSWTGLLRLPFPDGSCGRAGFLVSLPQGIIPNVDSYQTLGNVDIDVPAGSGVLANDSGIGLHVTGFQNPSASGGEVNVSPDGSFTYIPPAPDPNAFIGQDTFTYTVTDDRGASESVEVTIEVLNPVIWFIDADAIEPGDGRRQTPLNDIQVLNDDGNDPDNPGDFIYVFEAATPYVGGLLLENDQTLVGQEVSLAEIIEEELGIASSLQGVTVTDLPPFVVFPETDPTVDVPLLTNMAATLQMVDDTTAAGLSISSETGRAVVADSALNLLLNTVTANGGTSASGGQDGIYISGSDLRVLDSEIYGGDGFEVGTVTLGSSLQSIPVFNVNGGDGICASNSMLYVSGSLIQGGNGADAVEFGGDGGHGIDGDFGFIVAGSTLQGLPSDPDEITVVDSQVYGGTGGEGLGVLEGINESSSLLGGNPPILTAFGGVGGAGISVMSGVSMLAQESATLQGLNGDAQIDMTVSNSQVGGGTGGAGVHIGGAGGSGIESLSVNTTVDQASSVNGGVGGAAAVQSAGSGGNGISTSSASGAALEDSGTSLQGPDTAATGSLTVDGSTVTGGPAGSGPLASATFGGEGIYAIGGAIDGIRSGSSLAGTETQLQPVTITNSTISGADGIDNPTEIGGGAADGIFVSHVNLLVEAGSIVNGGAGGVGTTGADGADGIFAQMSPVSVNNSTVNGGTSGQSNDSVGATGGAGITFENCEICFTLEVIGSTINGGTGGFSLSMAGGPGGPGISGSNDSLDVSDSTVNGGEPGDTGSGRPGLGPAGTSAIIMTFEDPGPFTIDLANNTLVGSNGDAGQAPSLQVLVSTGTVCVSATGNIPTGVFLLENSGGTLGITQASGAALSADNNNVATNLTSVTFNCTLPTP